VAGAIAADRALRLLEGAADAAGLVTFDGLWDRLRALPMRRRRDCPLCGDAPAFTTLDPDRYIVAEADCVASPSVPSGPA
jgi:hypothetical protein